MRMLLNARTQQEGKKRQNHRLALEKWKRGALDLSNGVINGKQRGGHDFGVHAESLTGRQSG
jgi:hypothetical protein